MTGRTPPSSGAVTAWAPWDWAFSAFNAVATEGTPAAAPASLAAEPGKDELDARVRQILVSEAQAALAGRAPQRAPQAAARRARILEEHELRHERPAGGRRPGWRQSRPGTRPRWIRT